MEHNAGRTDVFEGLLHSAFFFDESENATDVFFSGENGGEDDRLFDFFDFTGIGPARWVVHFDERAIRLGDFVAHTGRGGDEVEAELALEALLNDFHVEQAEKAAAEAETEGNGTFRLEEK